MKVYYLAFRLDYLVPHFDLRREIRDAMGEFSRLLLATAAAQIPARAIRVATDGNSWWLKYCQAAIEDLPCLRTEGPADIVITDSQTGEGWYFSLNGQRLSPDLREFFWHANRGSHPIDLSLHSEDGVEGCLRIEPQHGFFWLEHHAAAMEAAPALLIVAILRRLGCSVRPADPPVQTHPSAASPGSLPLNWFRFKKFSRSLYLRMPGTGRPGRWSIGLHANSQQTIPESGWNWTCGFAGHEAADPFLVSYQDRLWLFFEDILPGSRLGRLAVMPVFEEPAEPSVILEKPYHLSYPCVFEEQGEWWMIPESSQHATVDLFHARRFPLEWEHSKTLIQGPRLVDTTPFFHEGNWYFFTTAELPGRAQISLLFVAETLHTPWRLHPASPLNGDAANARGAGPVSRWKGRLIRPVQDCLVMYGYSITLREILELSPTRFEDRPLEKILPSWHPGLLRTHTFSPAGQALALDGRR